MPKYLSKEEIKQWRSSLEKITLEEYALRLGKVIEEEKHTNDLVDIVLKDKSVMSKIDNLTVNRVEKINSIAQRAFEREKEISSNISFSSANGKNKKVENLEPASINLHSRKEKEEISLKDEVRLIFNKTLTEREQLVLDYFINNKNNIVYAKDLAGLLNLPRDYVYKYIKNLRAKINGGELQNADNGGYILSI
jgi:hypothetical protein